MTHKIEAGQEGGRRDALSRLGQHEAADHAYQAARDTAVLFGFSPLLSPREREVLRLLVIEKSNPEIAEALVIGRSTVRTHVSNILGTLGAKTRTEAAARARERGLI